MPTYLLIQLSDTVLVDDEPDFDGGCGGGGGGGGVVVVVVGGGGGCGGGMDASTATDHRLIHSISDSLSVAAGADLEIRSFILQV